MCGVLVASPLTRILMKKAISSLLVAVVLAGCATPPPSAPVQNSRTLNAPKSAVWPLVVTEISGSYPVKVIEKESGLLTTDWVILPAGFNNANAANWVKPPGGLLATWGGLRATLSVNVIENEPGKTTVSIRPHYEALENNVVNGWIVCESNGNLESKLFSNIEAKLPK